MNGKCTVNPPTERISGVHIVDGGSGIYDYDACDSEVEPDRPRCGKWRLGIPPYSDLAEYLSDASPWLIDVTCRACYFFHEEEVKK